MEKNIDFYKIIPDWRVEYERERSMTERAYLNKRIADEKQLKENLIEFKKSSEFRCYINKIKDKIDDINNKKKRYGIVLFEIEHNEFSLYSENIYVIRHHNDEIKKVRHRLCKEPTIYYHDDMLCVVVHIVNDYNRLSVLKLTYDIKDVHQFKDNLINVQLGRAEAEYIPLDSTCFNDVYEDWFEKIINHET